MVKKESDKLLSSLPACAAEFIKMVIKKMRYRRKVRQDVQAELAAHFEDELKDCATDKEKEQKAQQLIAKFGDMKLLAILLRRAKKRCRPLWRTVVARTFQAIGVLILCFILYVVWFFSGKPVVTIDYVAELNRMARPIADESLNAAPFYNEAARRYEKLSEDNKETFELLSKKPNEVTAEQKQIIEKWLTDNKETLELVITGSYKPYYWQKYEDKQNTGEMISVLMPHLAEFRRLAYSLRWQAYLRAEKGRYEDAFNDMKSCYRLGQHFRGDKTIIEQLVGIAVEALAVQTIRDIISKYQIDSSVLATLQKDFEQITADENFVVSFKVEKMMLYDEIQRCFTEDRLGGGHLYFPRLTMLGSESGFGSGSQHTGGDLLPSLKELRQIAHALFLQSNKKETKEMAEHFYDFWENIASESPGRLRAKGIDVNKESTEIIKGNLLLEIITPALSRVNEIAYRNKTDVQATLLLIAILRYKQTVGAYPNSLEELATAGYLKEIPIDSFSDKPLVYKKTKDDFILYSVGPNCVDDGGQSGKDGKGKPKLWVDNGDAVFWPVHKN